MINREDHIDIVTNSDKRLKRLPWLERRKVMREENMFFVIDAEGDKSTIAEYKGVRYFYYPGWKLPYKTDWAMEVKKILIIGSMGGPLALLSYCVDITN